jgi:hypothetical protein
MMNILSATVSAVTQAGHLVTIPMTALIPTTTLRIIPRAISVQLLVALLPWMDVEAQQRPVWTNTLAMSDHELKQKMQTVLRYRSGGATYLAFHLARVLECQALAWVLL